jgi:hypothetical protein
MTAATAERSFADSIFARLIALAIAIGIGFLLYANWGNDIRTVVEGDAPRIPVLATKAPVLGHTNAALQKCLAQRVGDVDKMKSDGVVNDAQYTSFRQRAEDLCRAQNPD